VRVPDLVIMDGVVGMQGNGPSARTLYPVGKILASDNGVALDSVMAAMMGLKPQEVDMLAYAAAEGLGEIDLSKIDIEGDSSPLKKFKKPISSVQRLIPRKSVRDVLSGPGPGPLPRRPRSLHRLRLVSRPLPGRGHKHPRQDATVRLLSMRRMLLLHGTLPGTRNRGPGQPPSSRLQKGRPALARLFTGTQESSNVDQAYL